MRVLYDHDFFGAFEYSGITRYFYEIMTRIAVMPGDRVSAFMGFHVNRYGLEKQRHLFDHFFGARRPSIPRTGRIFNALNGAGLRIFKTLARPDVYHQTYYRYMLPEFNGARIVTVHDMIYELFPALFNSNDPEILQKKISVQKADGIIAVSESTRRDLIDLWKIAPEKIRVIYHGNSLTASPDAASPLPDGPYILYVGQRIAHKNFQALLNVFCRTPWLREGYKLVCFGGFPFTADEIAFAQAHGAEDALVHMGGSDAVLASLYTHASTLVYTSLYEGFGLPIVEAMGLGCPVILSRTSSLLEVGREGGAFFDPHSPDELLSQLESVLQNVETREAMREAGRRHAATFTWEKCARETADFYREVSERKRAT